MGRLGSAGVLEKDPAPRSSGSVPSPARADVPFLLLTQTPVWGPADLSPLLLAAHAGEEALNLRLPHAQQNSPPCVRTGTEFQMVFLLRWLFIDWLTYTRDRAGRFP